jgi:Predicted amidohydrolase
MKIGICQINLTVGAINKNKQLILDYYDKSIAQGAELVVFPELAVTGYPPQDLLLRDHFLTSTAAALDEIASHTSTPMILGSTLVENNNLFNCSFICENGKILGHYKKILLPTYDVFDEDRYFKSGDKSSVFELKISNESKRIGLQICEDLWDQNYSIDLAESIKDSNADMIINISASPFGDDRLIERSNLIQEKVQKTGLPFIYCNLVGSQDELIFDGQSLVYNHEANLIAKGKTVQKIC